MRLEQLRYFVAVAEHRTSPRPRRPSVFAHAVPQHRSTRSRPSSGHAVHPGRRGADPGRRGAAAPGPQHPGRRRHRPPRGARPDRPARGVRLGATPIPCTSLLRGCCATSTTSTPASNCPHPCGSHDLVRDLGRGDLDLALIVLPAEGTEAACSPSRSCASRWSSHPAKPIDGPLRVPTCGTVRWSCSGPLQPSRRRAGRLPPGRDRPSVRGRGRRAGTPSSASSRPAWAWPSCRRWFSPTARGCTPPGWSRRHPADDRAGPAARGRLTHAARALHERIRSAWN